MSNTFTQALSLFEQLKQNFDKQPSDLEKCKEILPKLKEALTQISFSILPAGADETQARKELLLSREILEYATLLSVKLEDTNSFKRHVTQLKTYYFDVGTYKIPESQRMYSILGLNLLYLLASNSLADFHTELELISVDQHKNIYIKYPIQLEQYLMEGAYNKILSARADVPSESYTFFMNKLMNTVRDEIAECSEKAYRSLPFRDAIKILMFSSQEDLLNYVKERSWEIAGDRIIFKGDEKTRAEVPSQKIIYQSLVYAKELERID